MRHITLLFKIAIVQIVILYAYGKYTLQPNAPTWGDDTLQAQQKKAFPLLCEHAESRRYIPPKETAMTFLPKIPKEDAIQYSFTLINATYLQNNPASMPNANQAVVYDDKTASYCDMRQCDQSVYPFIYINIVHRNRPASALRLIESVRNSTYRCGVPDWLPCLCLQVSDFGSENVSMVDFFQNVWPERVRVVEKRSPADSFSRLKTVLFGIESISTPANRSLIMTMDTDLVLLSLETIDMALNVSHNRTRTFSPIIMSSHQSIRHDDKLWQYWNGKPHWEGRAKMWRRTGGSGMIWYYKDQVKFLRSMRILHKKVWGYEDWEFHHRLQKSVPIVRMTTPTLVHIFHPKKSWLKSKDGIH